MVGYVLLCLWVIIGLRMIYENSNKPDLESRVGLIYKIKTKRPRSYDRNFTGPNADLNSMLAALVNKQEPNERIVRINFYRIGQADTYHVTEADGTYSEINCEFICEYNEVTGTELEQFENMLLLASIK